LGQGKGGAKGGAAVEVSTLHDARFATTLELAVRFGKVLVVSEVDRLEPGLVPLLRRDLERRGPRFAVMVGDKAVDYHEDFRWVSGWVGRARRWGEGKGWKVRVWMDWACVSRVCQQAGPTKR
jgi:hypothetical protein